ncbi:DUF3592 domain-containing protein [Corallococcus llansteffanensis]|uniref:DUF3592 domain-containing protein n=1 Tax=Corallococcus llansteffanensis TaxID=2316731 RepID=A0A3A8QQB4_9BACT|nr:DUF3592 domain-containing protein [Corallococcus llansteffanensis]RKH67042.1 DUF3592 domain-containing protein [Corallococcus llansteffanensis]
MNLLAKVVTAALFVGGPALMLVLQWRDFAVTWRFQRRGQRVQGKVLRVDPGKVDDNAAVHYAFCLPDGTVLHHEYSETSEDWSALSPGSPLEVVYLPEDPRRSRPMGTGIGWVRTGFWTLVMLGFMAGGLDVLLGP